MPNTRRFDSKLLLFALTFFVGLTFIFPLNQAHAQKRRDHLTAEEIEIVRDVQAIDLRMLVFVRSIKRRFIVLDGGKDKLTAKQKKQVEKEIKIWGELPDGSKTQLLTDIDKILDESINKLEDVAERDEKNKLLPIALHLLSDYSKEFVPKLKKFGENNTNRREIAVINSSLQSCKDIIEAASKFERPEEKVLKKKKKKIEK